MTKICAQSCIIKPKNLPLTLQETKNFLRINYDEDDQLLNNMIATAAQRFENYTSRALILQTWQVSYRQLGRISVTLPIKPVVDVSKINLISINGQVKSYLLEDIDLDVAASEVIFNVYPYAYIIKITYQAGYGLSSEDIPSNIRSSLLNHVAAMYESRSITLDYPIHAYNEFKTMRL